MQDPKVGYYELQHNRNSKDYALQNHDVRLVHDRIGNDLCSLAV